MDIKPLLEQALSYWVEQVTAAAVELNEQLIKDPADVYCITFRMSPS